MIVLSDNDVILKLAQCDLLRYLPDILEEDEQEIYVSPATRFKLLTPRKPEKALKLCGSEMVYRKVSDFLDRVQEIPEIQDDGLLTQLGKVPHIDIGEQLLLATCMENPGSIFMTGDRRCLEAVIDNQALISTVHTRLIDSVITFESALLLSVGKIGFEALYKQLQDNPKPDSMMRLAMRSSQQDHVCGCFLSFTRPVYEYLAFKDRLPAQNVFS
ncbi:hypothetical protein RIN65_10335 [Pantoea agglomerans]|uniref:hypothetical protein n=1 Tax=Enterobacter agglomerans TaxID=549 RepID=UPI0028C42AEE|nr:hypothetical protein [Pantoea agglomerans]WNN32980.1 hypothetical protein RIN65_10335 [Pantoea agglomerans]